MKFGFVVVAIACLAAPAGATVLLRGANATAQANATANATAQAELLLKALTANEDKKVAAKKPVNASEAPHRAKLDVGFSDFEKNLTASVNASIQKVAKEGNWSNSIRDRLMANATQELSLGLAAVLKPVKQTIGKTWMALPQDDQKDQYVMQIKNAFSSVLDGSTSNIERHLQIALHRMNGYKQELTAKEQDDMLASTEASVASGLVGEHCYDELPKKGSKVKLASTNQTAPHKFCIPSTVESLAHRLNDTEGLIGMSMKFEAGALSLTQKEKNATKAKKLTR